MVPTRFVSSLPSFLSVCAFTYIHLSIFLYSFPVATSFPNYAPYFPNAKKLNVDGQQVLGLGHFSLTAPRTDVGSANPFGKRVNGLAESTGLDGAWAQICNEDSDLDGVLNKIELCDPDCTFVPFTADPDCGTGLALTHPGFAPGIGGDIPLYIKFHAGLMLTAWLFLAPFGILTALLFKKNSSGSVLWFKIHRASMLSTMCLTILAFLVMWFKTELAITSKHPKLGITVVVLSIFQPLSGWFRPHNPKNSLFVAKTDKRLFWEFQHQNTGRLAMLLAICAIITGLEAGYGEIDSVEQGTKALAVIFGLVSISCILYVFIIRERNAKEKVLEKDFETRRSILESGEYMEKEMQKEKDKKVYVPSVKLQNVSETVLVAKVVKENQQKQSFENIEHGNNKKQSFENPKFNKKSFESPNGSVKSIKNAQLKQSFLKSEQKSGIKLSPEKPEQKEIKGKDIEKSKEEEEEYNNNEEEEEVDEVLEVQEENQVLEENEEEEEEEEKTVAKKRNFDDFEV